MKTPRQSWCCFPVERQIFNVTISLMYSLLSWDAINSLTTNFWQTSYCHYLNLLHFPIRSLNDNGLYHSIVDVFWSAGWRFLGSFKNSCWEQFIVLKIMWWRLKIGKSWKRCRTCGWTLHAYIVVSVYTWSLTMRTNNCLRSCCDRVDWSPDTVCLDMHIWMTVVLLN